MNYFSRKFSEKNLNGIEKNISNVIHSTKEKKCAALMCVPHNVAQMRAAAPMSDGLRVISGTHERRPPYCCQGWQPAMAGALGGADQRPAPPGEISAPRPTPLSAPPRSRRPARDPASSPGRAAAVAYPARLCGHCSICVCIFTGSFS